MKIKNLLRTFLVLFIANTANAQNIPSTADQVLKDALTTKLNDDALAKIAARFRKNDPAYRAQVLDSHVSSF